MLFRSAGKSAMISKNPAGWLRKAIEQNYAAPKGLETREVKSKRAKATQERQEKQRMADQVEQYQKLLHSKPTELIWWDLEKWKKQYREEHNEPPSVDLIRRKEKELTAKLPNKEQLQIQIFGKVIYDEKGDLIGDQEKAAS
mgnify:CR=1 FL=1